MAAKRDLNVSPKNARPAAVMVHFDGSVPGGCVGYDIIFSVSLHDGYSGPKQSHRTCCTVEPIICAMCVTMLTSALLPPCVGLQHSVSDFQTFRRRMMRRLTRSSTMTRTIRTNSEDEEMPNGN